MNLILLLIGKGLPPFEQIQANHVVPAMSQLLEELKTELAQLEANLTPTWTGLVEPWDPVGRAVRLELGYCGSFNGGQEQSRIAKSLRNSTARSSQILQSTQSKPAPVIKASAP